MELLESDSFMKRVDEETKLSLSIQLNIAEKSILRQNDHVPFIRKSVLLSTDFDNMDNLQEKLCAIFSYHLGRIISAPRYELHWHYLGNDFSAISPRIMEGGLWIVARKAMLSNIGLPPVLIAKVQKLNTLGLPLHHPVKNTDWKNVKPRYIVHIGNKNFARRYDLNNVINNNRYF